MTSVGAEGRAPFKAVLTHGFTIDESGKKMSKSLGNVVDPQVVVKEFGADVLRLWVASTDFKNDMSASKDILKQVADAFSKIRNTCRFIMSNLNDFDPDKDAVAYKDMEEIDKFALLNAQKLVEKCGKAYDEFEFHLVFHSIYGFCVNELSSFYFDVIKDRLYCESKSGKLRRSSQTAMNEILRMMVKLYAPVLSFTSEDIWKHINSKTSDRRSIFEEDFPEIESKYLDKKLEDKWNKLLEIRSEVYKVIENARAEKLISHPLEARVEVSLDGNDFQLMKSMEDQLPSIFIVSEFVVSEGGRDIAVKKAEGKKCDRCWMYLGSVGESHEHPGLCDRCVSVVGKMI